MDQDNVAAICIAAVIITLIVCITSCTKDSREYILEKARIEAGEVKEVNRAN